VAAFDLPVLLRASWLDVSMPNPERLNGQREGEGELVPVVTLQLSDPEGKRAAELDQEGEI